MARVDVKPEDIFPVVLAQFRTSLSLNERTCFLVADVDTRPTHPMGNEDGWWLQIGGGGESFDGGLFLGGGRDQCTAFFEIQVGVFTRVYLDETDHDEQVLLKLNRGLHPLKWKVINAFSGTDLQIDGNEFQRELWRPTGATAPRLVGTADNDQFNPGIDMGNTVVSFVSGFDYDLETL